MGYNKYNFQKLTPISDADITVYEEALNFALQEPDIKNIAITGSYSSGKSSVLNSYVDSNQKAKIMRVSLAYFSNEHNNIKVSPTSNEGNELMTQLDMEGKIINQILHQISNSVIKETNFKIKANQRKANLVFYATGIVCYVVSIAFLFNLNSIHNLFELSYMNYDTVLKILFHKYTIAVVFLFVIVSTIFCVYKLIKAQTTNQILKRITFKNAEFDLFSNQTKSYFDKYLNDLIYLLVKSNYDVVVFEDIDRFDSNKVFERLREINDLANMHISKKSKWERFCSSLSYSNKKYFSNLGKALSRDENSLKFIYLLRDDIFLSKDRTKFFDYIMPVVPVVDSSNSYHELDMLFDNEYYEIIHSNGDSNDKIDKAFLQAISIYIDDMRLLKNIFNEFTIYIELLTNSKLDLNKMFALIVYKNIYPTDFSKLQIGKGYIWQIIELKDDYLKILTKTKEDDKEKYSKKVDSINKEMAKSTEELHWIKNSRYSKLNSTYNISGSEKNKLIRENENDIDDRLTKLNARINNELEINMKLLSEVTKQLDHLKTSSLKTLIEYSPDNTFENFLLEKITGDDEKAIVRSDHYKLIIYLIRSGNIDKTYAEYMTYFKPGGLSVSDKIFLRRIVDRAGKDYSYELKNPEMILKQPLVIIEEFSRSQMLNYDILNELLKNIETINYRKYLTNLLNNIKENVNHKFINGFYSQDRQRIRFIQELLSVWPEYLSSAKSLNGIDDDYFREITIYAITECGVDNLIEFNKNGFLSNYISNCDDYLNISDCEASDIIDSLTILNVSFIKLNYEKSNIELFKMVYENSLYEYSYINIIQMLENIYHYQKEELKHKYNKVYTLIASNKESPLMKYTLDNMDIFMDFYLVMTDEQFSDDEEFVLELIHNENIKLESITNYCKRLNTKLSDVNTIKNRELWNYFYDRDGIEFSISNIMDYFVEFGLDKYLIKLINRTPKSFKFTMADTKYSAEQWDSLRSNVMINSFIDKKIYKRIVENFDWKLVESDIVGKDGNALEIENELIAILIDSKAIDMTSDNLNFIRTKHKELLYRFIELNITEYIELLDDDYSYDEELLAVINLDINDDLRKLILEKTITKISILQYIAANDEFEEVAWTQSVSFIAYVICHNYIKSDFDFLFENYYSLDKEIQKSVFEIAPEVIDLLHENKYSIGDRLISELLLSKNISIDEKVKILNQNIKMQTEETMCKHFEELGVSELSGIFYKDKRTKYSMSNVSTKLLSMLKDNKWIQNFYIDNRLNDKYVVEKSK